MASEAPSPDDRDWQAVRQTIGYTQRKLAAKLGTNKQAVRRWESGDKTPAIAYQREMLSILEERSPEGCGCVGCLEDAVAVIDHPEHGERTVCKSHINGHPVKRRLAHV